MKLRCRIGAFCFLLFQKLAEIGFSIIIKRCANRELLADGV